MKSWTLIPFYLWKNTCRRWLEYPVSPLSKVLITTLLGFLAVIVLTLFGEIERELRDQLARNSVYTVAVSEFVGGENAATILHRSFEEEVLWSDRYGKDVIKQLRQPLMSAFWNRTQNVPFFAFTASLSDFQDTMDLGDAPIVWMLSNDVARQGQWVEVSVSNKRTLAKVRPVPPWIGRELSLENAVAAPVELVEPYLHKGFINHMIANLDSLEHVERFVSDVSSYYRAENRQVKIVSSLGILKNLERINGIQRIVRTLIVVGCGVILSLTLGSIAWLEYRQDSYLLALLKSFGTPSFLLLLHMFLENLLLVLAGILLVRLAWVPLFQMASPQMHSIGLHASGVPNLPASDLAIIVLASVIGVVLAMIPVAFGLRRPPGLILQ